MGYVDVMLTMRSAHCICFYEFKQDQLRLTIFNSITNYIFWLLRADVCKYRPEMGKIKFLKNPPKIL